MNKLSINFKKTTCSLIIAPPRKKVSINVTACDIQQTSDIKYLGIFIDDTLK